MSGCWKGLRASRAVLDKRPSDVPAGSSAKSAEELVQSKVRHCFDEPAFSGSGDALVLVELEPRMQQPSYPDSCLTPTAASRGISAAVLPTRPRPQVPALTPGRPDRGPALNQAGYCRQTLRAVRTAATGGTPVPARLAGELVRPTAAIDCGPGSALRLREGDSSAATRARADSGRVTLGSFRDGCGGPTLAFGNPRPRAKLS